MLKQYFKKNPIFNVFDGTLVSLPAPRNISILWNFGSLLRFCLIIQIVSGVLLASYYAPSIDLRFSMIFKIIESADKGWLIRYIHANGASLFFLCIFLHTGRGLYYGSFNYKHTWNIGVTILLLTMAAAFLGYVLPVNQISFWGASVITNLFTEVPYIGGALVQLIWGGVSVHDPTIIRFFTFHFILPFIIIAAVAVHITLLHQTGSRNPLGLQSFSRKLVFHSYYRYKDLIGVLLITLGLRVICVYYPLVLGDDENFTLADAAVTPHHIQPEWYFLFAYAILRSVPNKLGGVIALAFSIIILYATPILAIRKNKRIIFYPAGKILFWAFTVRVILLTWIGIRPVEEPYVITGQILTAFYFIYYFLSPLIGSLWDKFTQI